MTYKLCSKSKLYFRESQKRPQSDLDEGRMASRGKNVLNATSKAMLELDDQKEEADLHLRFDSPRSEP